MDNTTRPVIRKRIAKSQRRRDGLIQYAINNKTSQNGEDGIIAKIFELLSRTSPLPAAVTTTASTKPTTSTTRGKTRWCVDVGAWDGKHLSNTYSLLVPHSSSNNDDDDPQGGSSCCCWSGWRGILIEADHQRFQELEALHRPYGNTCINANVSSNPTSSNSLVTLLTKAQQQLQQQQQEQKKAEESSDDNEIGDSNVLPFDFDFLSIDVDGSDYWILHDVLTTSCTTASESTIEKAFFKPKVICIEFNPTMDNDLIYIPPRNDNIRHGASLAALVELAESHGYTLVETTLFNAFFVQTDLYHSTPSLKHLVPDPSIEALHETTMGTTLYQLYDGTIKLDGCKKLLWHRIAIDEKKIQVLPADKKSFPFAPNTDYSSTANDDTETWMQQFNDQVIDMSVYCQQHGSVTRPHSDEDKNACSELLLERLQADGFALVKGTGISATLCREALRSTHSFLHEADENVRRSCLAPDRARRGYSPINTENFASLIGEDGPNDLVRKFRIGPPTTNEDGHRNSLLQPNIWPTSEVWDETSSYSFKSTIEQYYAEISSAADCIVDAICDGLVKHQIDLAIPLSALSRSHDGSEKTRTSTTTSILTLLGYRTGNRHKQTQKKRHVHPLVAAHTDVGVITMLLFDGGSANDSCGILQRKVKNSDPINEESTSGWADVVLPTNVPDDPVFVINIADCLSALSRHHLPSTLHRVWPSKGISPRNSLALFVGLDPNQILQMEDGEMTYEVWRKKRIAESKKVIYRNKRVAD